jgi:hypothetical protein
VEVVGRRCAHTSHAEQFSKEFQRSRAGSILSQMHAHPCTLIEHILTARVHREMSRRPRSTERPCHFMILCRCAILRKRRHVSFTASCMFPRIPVYQFPCTSLFCLSSLSAFSGTHLRCLCIFVLYVAYRPASMNDDLNTNTLCPTAFLDIYFF